MKMHYFAAAVAAALAPFVAAAQEMQMQEAPSLPAFSGAPLPARTIAFTDHRKDELVDPITGMIRFSDWQRLRPQEKKLLTLFPSYEEPMAPSTESPGKMRPRRLYVYVAEARFAVPRPAETIDLSKLVTLAVLEKLDPSIKHKVITPADIIPNKDPKFAANKNPDRPWCEGPGVLCIQSNYKLEGRLPTGIMLVNKIRESGKQIADFLDFQSELRVIPPS
jgi:hypothetical protein